MSKDNDLESDSPVSRHDLDYSESDADLVEPTSGHCSFEVQNDNIDLDNIVFIRKQTRDGGR